MGVVLNTTTFTQNLARRSVWNERDVDEDFELDLCDIDESEHKEAAIGDGADAKDEHADVEGDTIDMSDKELDDSRVIKGCGGGVGKANGVFESDGDKAGEEEGAKGVKGGGDGKKRV
ncbi:hypothetical protein E2542_SST11320 [Spatholobus suberectus]|nr:hypothetical protein E2542_SST11320 [Spatholobus suberectus]